MICSYSVRDVFAGADPGFFQRGGCNYATSDEKDWNDFSAFSPFQRISKQFDTLLTGTKCVPCNNDSCLWLFYTPTVFD